MITAQQLENDIRNWKEMGLSKAEIVLKQAEEEIGWPYVWGAVGADCTVAKREYYMGRSSIGESDRELIRKRCQVLNGSASYCDGCKYYPNGRVKINDCQGFVKMLCKNVGITLSGGGCTSMWGDNSNWSVKGEISQMPVNQICLVFKHISSTGKMDHVGLHIGQGQIIHCSGEVKRGSTNEKGWTHYAIPKGLEGDAPVPIWRSTIRKGSKGDDVVYCQEMLEKLGYDLGSYGVDGKFGNKTLEAVKQFQRDHGLNPDGIVGPLTWDALENATPSGDLYTVTIRHLPKYKAEALLKQYDGGASMEKEE